VDLAETVSFLRTVFDATGEVDPGRPAELRIGDSLVMVSAAAERDVFLHSFTFTSTTPTSVTPARLPRRDDDRTTDRHPYGTGGRWCATRRQHLPDRPSRASHRRDDDVLDVSHVPPGDIRRASEYSVLPGVQYAAYQSHQSCAGDGLERAMCSAVSCSSSARAATSSISHPPADAQ